MDELVIYTDGSCIGNGTENAPGGWAWAIDKAIYVSGFEPNTTNQRMEIRAALEAIRAHDRGNRFPQSIVIVSDSKYVVDCFLADPPWWKKWIANGFKSAERKPIKNQDLWQPLIELYRAQSDSVRFRWVRGHNGDPMNEFVDQLAQAAARSGKGVNNDPPF